MNTSYFTKSGQHPNAVSIALKEPPNFKGRKYKKLAPKLWFLKKYKKDLDTEEYTSHYYKEVLDKLDPQVVFKELGLNAILLCWEGKTKFCHRHLVAKWLEKHIGIPVKEL